MAASSCALLLHLLLYFALARADLEERAALKIKNKLVSRRLANNKGLLLSAVDSQGDDGCHDQQCHDKQCKKQDKSDNDDCHVSTSICVKACKNDDEFHGKGNGRCADQRDTSDTKHDRIFTFPGTSDGNRDVLWCHDDYAENCDAEPEWWDSWEDLKTRRMHCAKRHNIECEDGSCSKLDWTNKFRKCCVNGNFDPCKDCSD